MRVLAEEGWRIRVLARRDPIDPLWRELVPEVVVGDVSNGPALSRLCAGADVVIHAAGLVKARSRAAFDAVNVEGARQVAVAAAEAAHIVLVSSLTAREPGLSHYSASKHAGEVAMAQIIGNRLTVARPCAIYGPGDRELLAVFQAADSLPMLPILSATGRIAMIHVEDAARQIVALCSEHPQGWTYELSDARIDGYFWRELMAEAARACGTSPRLVAIPPAVIQAIGITNDFTKLLGGTPMLTSAKARELLHENWAIAPDQGPACSPTPIYDLKSGFAQTVAWYRTAAWMKQ